MPIPEKFIQDLVDRSDIVDVVSGYVRLSKRSGANMFGLCPFHSEKTPSFSVSPDKQIYHCFGCGKGGGVISFIMEIENLSYPEAIEFLAKRAGLEVPEDSRAAAAESRQRARLHRLRAHERERHAHRAHHHGRHNSRHAQQRRRYRVARHPRGGHRRGQPVRRGKRPDGLFRLQPQLWLNPPDEGPVGRRLRDPVRAGK